MGHNHPVWGGHFLILYTQNLCWFPLLLLSSAARAPAGFPVSICAGESWAPVMTAQSAEQPTTGTACDATFTGIFPMRLAT